MNLNKQICKSLKKTYNTYIIDGLNDEDFIKELCKRIYIQKNYLPKSILNKFNYTLLKLIYNKYYRSIPIFDNIAGPCSLTLYKSEKYKKSIYVFGEQHCDNNNIGLKCPKNENFVTISQFLNICSKNSPVFLDIFIEYPSAAKYNDQVPAGMIGDIYIPSENGKCFNDSKIRSIDMTESCSSTRWHFTDVRFNKDYKQTSLAGYIYYDVKDIKSYIVSISENIQLNKIDLLSIFNLVDNNQYFKKLLDHRVTLLDLKNSFKNDRNNFGLDALLKSMGVTNSGFVGYKILAYFVYVYFRPEMIDFYRKYESGDVEGLKEWAISQYFNTDNDNLLKKELNRSYESDVIKKFLNKRLEEEINEIKVNLSSISSWIIYTIDNEKFIKNNIKDFIVTSKYINIILSNMGCLFTDCYTISRIFKKFKLLDVHNMPDSPSNIITYAGDVHARNLRDFFENYIDDFDKLGEVHNDSCPKFGVYYSPICCLNMKGIPQPFFSKRVSS